jgi:stage II sporulation protein AB (anti-sigma F factor)
MNKEYTDNINLEETIHYHNEMELFLKSASKNESFARVSVAAFVSQLDPTVSELTDIKTAVSEAVTNAIIHGYGNSRTDEKVHIICKISETDVYIEVRDNGRGIQDIEEAMTPLFTSNPELERSGMGFTVMETFMPHLILILD